MRVTQSHLTNNLIGYMSKNYRNIEKLQTQLSTGVKLHKPSDDPEAVSKSIYYRSQLVEVETFKNNAKEATNWLEITDDAMTKANDILIRVKELITVGASDSWGMDSRQAMADEIEQLVNHLGDIANSRLNGRYVFGGTDTDIKPYDSTDGLVNLNNDTINVEIGPGSSLPLNVTGQQVFNYNGGLFTKLNEIVTKLRDSTVPGDDISNLIGDLNNQQDHLLAVQSMVGSRMNRIELAVERLDQQELNLNKFLTENEDIDLAQVITQLTSQEQVHRASLSVGAKIIQTSLMDFLR